MSSRYDSDHLNNLSISDLRSIAQKYGSSIPGEKSNLVQFILEHQNMSSSLKRRISDVLARAQPLPDTINVSVYKGSVNRHNYDAVLTQHYMFEDNQGSGTLLEYYPVFNEKDLNQILQKLGLANFKGTYADRISLINLIPGLNWDPVKAKEITSLSYETVLSLSDLDYMNCVLAYVTGSYLFYDVSVKDTSRYNQLVKRSNKYVIMTYVAFCVMPQIHQHNTRKLEHLYVTLASTDLGESTKYFDMIDNRSFSEIVKQIRMVPPPKMANIEYFLNSAWDYREVRYNDPNNSAPIYLLNRLQYYNDSIILDIIEEPFQYRYRSDLIHRAREELTTYRWSLNRSKYCKNFAPTSDIILSFGRAVNYYCFNLDDVSELWSIESVRRNGGFLRPGYEVGEPHKYLSVIDIDEFEIFIRNHPQRDMFKRIRHAMREYQTSPRDMTRILIICFDEYRSKINNRIVQLLKNTYNVDVDLYIIDYISADIMYINDEYTSIPFGSFPNEQTLEILKYAKYDYDYIVYEYCPLGIDTIAISPLIDYSVLDILNDKLSEDGRLIVTAVNAKNVNRISERFTLDTTIDRISIFKKMSRPLKRPAKKPPVQQFPIQRVPIKKLPIKTPLPTVSTRTHIPKPVYKPTVPPPVAIPKPVPKPIPKPVPKPTPKPVSLPSSSTSYLGVPQNPIERTLGVDWRDRWNIVRNEGGGDCLYCVISQALATIGIFYPTQELRDIIAQSVTPENEEHWSNEIKADMIARQPMLPGDKSPEYKNERVAIEMRDKKYTIAEIRQYIRGKRFGTIDDIKILSEILAFTPIVLPNNDNYISDICAAVTDYGAIVYGNILSESNIILIRLDVGGPHYELIEQKGTEKAVFKSDELPPELLVAFVDSCLQQLEFLGQT